MFAVYGSCCDDGTAWTAGVPAAPAARRGGARLALRRCADGVAQRAPSLVGPPERQLLDLHAVPQAEAPLALPLLALALELLPRFAELPSTCKSGAPEELERIASASLCDCQQSPLASHFEPNDFGMDVELRGLEASVCSPPPPGQEPYADREAVFAPTGGVSAEWANWDAQWRVAVAFGQLLAPRPEVSAWPLEPAGAPAEQ